MSQFYRLHDAEPCGMHATPAAELEKYNREGFGIFGTVQAFDGPRRIENLVRIRAWAVDIDRGSKESQIERLHRSPLKPSSIVETKQGFHAYWYARDAKAENYRAVASRLVEFFDGDRNARDLARVMRVPGFLHQKDPANPFPVRRVWGPIAAAYNEASMALAFPPSSEELGARDKAQAPATTPTVVFPSDKASLWERAFDLDAREALPRLSGHWSVGGEQYELRPQRNGKTNIWVDGKSTSCFIDAQGKIGSSDKGGPGVAQWIRWHTRDYRKVKDALLEVFPELKDSKEAA
jgi:hypothetical protein